MRHTTYACAIGALMTLACDDGTGATDADASITTPFQDQVEWGAMLYGEHCATCHGDAGQGTSLGPRVVGLDEGALPLDPPPAAMFRSTQFVTVGDVAAFAAANMPADAPASLTLDEYLAILAFDLFANGIELDDALTLDGAAGLTIPREDD